MLFQKLKTRLQQDSTYKSGKILGSMCTEPHSLAKRVYMQCLEKNLGDPYLFPATAELEQEVIQMFGSLLSTPNAHGHIVSGGTEANILALWTARNLVKRKRSEVIASVSSHFSFDKAADLLGLKLVKIGLNSRFQIDIEAVEESITANTCNYRKRRHNRLGVVDPISELSEIALANDVYFHVDSAFGGFVLPFLKNLRLQAPAFDFRFSGVHSITIDPHKIGFAPIPAGGMLFRDASIVKPTGMKVSYLAGGETNLTTLVGTRSGTSVITVWTLLMHLGRAGYETVVKRCMKLKWMLTEGVRQIDGVSLVTQPIINIVGIKSDVIDVQLITKELRKKGWAISLFAHHIRIVVMPHTKSSYIKAFLDDLREITKSN
jgi:tyrosine decarboxylase/aspartate 1-decarboxylase